MTKIIYFSKITVFLVLASAFSVKAQDVKDYFRGMPIEKIEVSGAIAIKIKHSEDTHVKISTNDLKNVEMSCKSGVLKLDSKNYRGVTAEIYIHEGLEKISLKKGVTLTSDEGITFKKIKFEIVDATITKTQMKGNQAIFSMKRGSLEEITLTVSNISATLKKASSFTGKISDAKSVEIDSDEKSKIEIKGKTKNLSINSVGTTINASELEAQTVDVVLKDYANVSVFAKEKLNISIKSVSTLKRKGSAEVKVKKLAEGSIITAEPIL